MQETLKESIIDKNTLDIINQCRCIINNRNNNKEKETISMVEQMNDEMNMQVEFNNNLEDMIPSIDIDIDANIGVPVINDINPVEVEEMMNDNNVSDVTAISKKNKKNSKKKDERDINEIINEFLENINTMTHEMKYDYLVQICGESSAATAKKLELRPANRILESIRGNRLLKGEALNKVYEYYKNHEKIKNNEELYNIITPEFFVGEKED